MRDSCGSGPRARALCCAALAALVAMGAAGGAAATPLPYRLVGIGHLPMLKDPPDPDASFAHDVNDAGVVVGQSTTSIGSPPNLATSDFHAVRFTEAGGLQDLGDLASGGDTSAANGINGAGVIAGRGDTSEGIPPSDVVHAARWPDPGTIEDIGAGTQFSEGVAINDLGHIAGSFGPSGGRQGFHWTPGGGRTTLASPGGAFQTFAEDLNDSDWIVGHATLAGGERALLWQGAAAAPLDLGDLDGDGGESFALGLNDAGWIVGGSDDDGEQRAFRRDPATGILEGLSHLPGGDFGRANDVNASRTVVGSAWDPASLAFHAVLWEPDGTIHDLHDLLVGDVAGWVLEEARAISDTGFIAGLATNPAGDPEGVLLVPIPEPGAAALLLPGLALLAARRRRSAGGCRR